MSGQVIAVPLIAGGVVVIGAGLALAGVAAGAYGAAKLIQSMVDERVEAALREIEREKAKIREWEHFQAVRREEMAVLERAQLALGTLEKQLVATRLSDAHVRSTEDGPTAKGYVTETDNKTEEKAIEAFLAEISSILGGISDKFIQLDGSPLKKLLIQEKMMHGRLGSGTKLTLEEIRSFREVVIRTCTSYTASVEARADKQRELFNLAGSLLDNILLYSRLTVDIKEVTELQNLRSHLLNLMNAGEIPSGQMEFMEKRFDVIRTAVDQRLAESALREALADSVERNLADMGYEAIEGFSEERSGSMLTARMKIPGGEQVRIAIQHNNSISFEVCHEAVHGEVSIDDLAIPIFRECEKKWCLDLQELIRRLTLEGFSYKINFERFIPALSIPLVIVESADDILADEEDDEAEGYKLETHEEVRYHDSE